MDGGGRSRLMPARSDCKNANMERDPYLPIERAFNIHIQELAHEWNELHKAGSALPSRGLDGGCRDKRWNQAEGWCERRRTTLDDHIYAICVRREKRQGSMDSSRTAEALRDSQQHRYHWVEVRSDEVTAEHPGFPQAAPKDSQEAAGRERCRPGQTDTQQFLAFLRHGGGIPESSRGMSCR